MATQQPSVHAGNGQSLLLADFLKRRFVPERLKNAKRRAAAFLTMLEQFETTLERPATVADMTAQSLLQFMRAATNDGRIKAQRQPLEMMFLSLWRYAHRVGAVSNYQTAKPTALRRSNSFLGSPPGPGTLSYVYKSEIAPTIKLKSRSAIDCRNSVLHKLNEFRGYYVTIDEINSDLIEGLFAWLERCGKSKSYVKKSRYALSVILDPIKPGIVTRIPRVNKYDQLPAPEPGTVRWLFETRYLPERLVDASDTTIRDYRWMFVALRKHSGRDVALGDLTDLFVSQFMRDGIDRGLVATTVNYGYRAPLLALWRFARECGLIDRDPRVKKLRETVDPPDSWSAEELKSILAATSQMNRDSIHNIPVGKYLRALVLLVWWTGMRRGTALRLTWQDLDRESGWIHVPGRSYKNRRGQSYRLGDDALMALDAIRLPLRERIFPMDRHAGRLHSHFNKLLELANIAPSRRRSGTHFHKVRRSTATAVAQVHGIAAAAELLGHSATDVTLRYVDPSKMPQRDGTKMLPSLTDTTQERKP